MISLTSFIGAFFPELSEGLLSTQGIMVMLLVAYGGAMWLFLTSAPKVYTVMVSDLEIAKEFYEGLLDLSVAQVPLHYYYNYEQTLATSGIDPIHSQLPTQLSNHRDGLWYQLKKNTQLHIIGGANLGDRDHQRHVSFDRDCLQLLLSRSQKRGVKYKIRTEKPLNFLVKDQENRIIEMTEISS